MRKRKKKRKEKVDSNFQDGWVFCNAAILGDNTDFY